MSKNTHPFERWMNHTLRRNGGEWNRSARREQSAFSKDQEQSASSQGYKPHSILKSASKQHKESEMAANRARDFKTRPMRQPYQESSGYDRHPMRDMTSQEQWRPQSHGPQNDYYGSQSSQSPWYVPSWMSSSGHPDRSSWYPDSGEYGRRSGEQYQQGRGGQGGQGGMSERRDGWNNNDRYHVDAYRTTSEYDRDMTGFNQDDHHDDPFQMMEDYFESRNHWPSSMQRMMSSDNYEWHKNEEGQLVLSTKLPKGIEASDVNLSIEDGFLRLRANKSHEEQRQLKGSGSQSRHSSQMSIEHHWPLERSLSSKDVHANYDSHDGVLEIKIDIPANSTMEKLLERAETTKEGDERFGSAEEHDFVDIPVSGKSESKISAEKKRNAQDLNRSDGEGMHRKDLQNLQKPQFTTGGPTGETLKEMGQKTADLLRTAASKAGDMMESAKETISEAMETTTEKASELYNAKDTTKKAGEMAEDAKDAVKDKASELYNSPTAKEARKKAGDMVDDAKDAAMNASERATDMAAAAKKKLGDSADAVKDTASRAMDDAQDKASELYRNSESARTKASQASESAKESAYAAAAKAKDTVDDSVRDAKAKTGALFQGFNAARQPNSGDTVESARGKNTVAADAVKAENNDASERLSEFYDEGKEAGKDAMQRTKKTGQSSTEQARQAGWTSVKSGAKEAEISQENREKLRQKEEFAKRAEQRGTDPRDVNQRPPVGNPRHDL